MLLLLLLLMITILILIMMILMMMIIISSIIIITYPLLIWIHISDAKVVFLQQVEVVTDEVKQILSLRIPLEREREEAENQLLCLTI